MSETAQVLAERRADAEVGRHVHMLMWDRQVKQAELATRLGIQQSALSKKLRGHRPWSVDELLTTSRFLNTTVAYLVGEIDDAWCTPRDLNPEPTDSESVVGHLAEVVSIDSALSLREPIRLVSADEIGAAA